MARARLTRVLALLFPPVVVLSSAHELYLRNQAELGWTLSVLLLFWAAALATIAAGLVLQRTDRRRFVRVVLWAYYVAGFSFLLWGFLRALPQGAHVVRWILDTTPGATIYGIGCTAALVAAARRKSPRWVEPALAVLAVVLTARDVALFATRLEKPPPPAAARDIVAEVGTGGSRALPNIYHLLLDSFPDALLEPCLPAEATRLLDGFVRFRLASPVRSTEYVLPAIFTGRWVPANEPERLREALTGPTSLLSDLRRAGYRTLALVPVYIYAKSPSAVDSIVYHEESAPSVATSRLHAATFRQLWAYSTLPVAMIEPLARRSFFGLDAETFRAADALHAATSAGPVLSRAALNRLIELEPRLPDRGRYTLVHVMLPHPPHVLRSDCSDSGAAVTTDLKQQTDCTLLLVTRFLGRLHTLGRLAGSIVVIQGDHGPGRDRAPECPRSGSVSDAVDHAPGQACGRTGATAPSETRGPARRHHPDAARLGGTDSGAELRWQPPGRSRGGARPTSCSALGSRLRPAARKRACRARPQSARVQIADCSQHGRHGVAGGH